MESHPRLQRCVTDCIHCGIRFLTHPRNAGRRDLRCPFGCRQHHRKRRSSQRSTAYYQTAVGRWKKKRLNFRRNRSTSSADGQPQQDLGRQASRPNGQLTDELQVKVELRLEGMVLDESSLLRSRMLPYVRMLVGLIEGIELSRDGLVEVLRQAMRQHSIANRRRVDYVLCFLHQHPP